MLLGVGEKVFFLDFILGKVTKVGGGISKAGVSHLRCPDYPSCLWSDTILMATNKPLPVLQDPCSMALGPKTQGSRSESPAFSTHLRPSKNRPNPQSLKRPALPLLQPCSSPGRRHLGDLDIYPHPPFTVAWELRSWNCLLNGPRQPTGPM